MNPRRLGTGLLRGLGYLAFFVFFVFVFAVLTFPTERARQYMAERGSAAVGGDVDIAELDLGLGSAELTGVKVELPEKRQKRRPGMPPPRPKENSPPKMLSIERVYLDASLLGLMFGGAIEVDFEADVQGGEIRGGRLAWSEEKGARLAVGEMRGVRVGPEGFFERATSYDVRGILGGTFDVTRGPAASQIEGAVDVALSDARIAEPVIPTKQLGPVQLTDIRLGELQLKLRAGKASELGMSRKGRYADQTIIHFTDVGANGPDLKIEFHDSSVIRLREGQPMKQAMLDVHFAVKFTDSFIDMRVEDDDGRMSQPNKFLRMAFRQDAGLRSAMRDGVLGITCRGVLARPDCNPEAPRIRGGFKKRAPKFTPDEETPEEEPGGTTERMEEAESPRGVPEEDLERARRAGEPDAKRPTRTRRPRPEPRGRRAIPAPTREDRPSPSRRPRPNSQLEAPNIESERPQDEEEAEEDLPPEDEEPLPEDEEYLDEEGLDEEYLDEERLDEEDLPPEEDY
ncbi:MAG: type II secretion system protein GspN [Myxococcota bacterium]